MKILLCLLFLLFQTTSLLAQSWKADLQKADSLMQKRDFEGAAALYELVLPAIEKDSTNKSEAFLKTRNSLGRSGSYFWEVTKSAVFLDENLKLCKQYGIKSVIYAQALHNTGTFYMLNLDGSNAEPSERLLKEAIVLRKEIMGEKHIDCASTLNSLGNLYSLTGRFSLAEVAYKQTLSIRKEVLGIKHSDYGISVNNLALLYSKMGKYSEAESLYKEAVEIMREKFGDTHPQYASALNGLASLYIDIGNYDLAESLLLRAFKIRKNKLGEKHPVTITSVASLANFYHAVGSYSKAQRFYEESLKGLKEAVGEEHEYYAGVLNNLALSYVTARKLPQAEMLYKESLQIKKTVYGEKHPDYIRTLMNFAVVYQEMGSYAISGPILQTCIKLSKEVLGENHFEYAQLINILANYYNDIGSYKASEECYNKCLDILEVVLGKNNPEYIMVMDNLSRLHWLMGKKAETMSEKTLVKNWCIEQIHLQFSHMSEVQREAFYNEKIKHYVQNFNTHSIEMTAINTSALYDLQLSCKAVLMQASQKMKNRILTSGDTALIRKYWEWNNLKQQIMKANDLSEAERQEKGIQIDQLANQSEELEKALSLKSEAFASLTDKKRLSWQDIQKTLKKGEAAVEMVKINKFGVQKIMIDTSDVTKAPNFPKYPFYDLTDTVYYAALIVKKNSKEPEIVLLKNGNELEDKFFKYQNNAIQYTQEDLVSYDQFWLPIAQKLKGIKKVYFSPDGVYNQISLNTLQNPKTKKFVLDEIELHLVTNTKDILAFGNSENKTLKAELLGYPLYNLQKQDADNARMREVLADSTRAFANFQQVSLLPGTKKEVEDIFQILSQKKYSLEILTEQNATEENIKKVKNPKILHLSTHGFFIDSKEKNEKVNPMLRSGLLLTGVSDYTRAEVKPDTEDGILTALEAANLDLDETDLVVLSACETGLGDVKAGEGVYGLQRAFKVAGAKSIVMSMWKVDDAVTQKLMTTFYQKFAESNKARQAFKEAQAIIKKQHPEPYYWGAFVMVGE